MLKLWELIKSRLFTCSSVSECVIKFINNFYKKTKETRLKFKVLFEEIFRRIRSAH